MKTFDDLNQEQQEKAVHKCLVQLLDCILEGGIWFNDELNGDDLQARIDAAIAEADRMQTPWLAASYVKEAIDAELSGMALANAMDALYPEPGEHIVHGVAWND